MMLLFVYRGGSVVAKSLEVIISTLMWSITTMGILSV
ncbi:hypothetical protein Goarm_013183 [Gossypium armourianum]|uniref:Uncharacterized protein n=2 Tax=Gossypium TaxID=3633 RepID=A0A7J9J299_9ROSI|nr:hypothetical protein [Gossypium armourianum]